MLETIEVIFSEVKRKYDEAFAFLGQDLFLLNPEKAYSIFSSLADEGFVVAKFYKGLMLCMGMGIEKDLNQGRLILQLQESFLGYSTEVILEQHGLFKELTIEEKLKCIDFWKTNHQTTHALWLQQQI